MKSSCFKVFAVLLLFGFCGSVTAQKRVRVNGKISGHEGEALPGATVIDAGNKNKGTYSNANGYYSFSLAPGEVKLLFSYVGYNAKEVILMLNSDTTVNVSLTGDNSIEAVTVYAREKYNNAMSSRLSVLELPVTQVKTTPALFGETDVLKYIQLMPGIQSGGDGNVGLYIRGGNYDQNMITLDGATIYNPEHMKGFVSVFNADILDKVTVYKGSFPAMYGSRLSGVVDIGIKNGDHKSYHGSGTIGLLSAKFYLEGPLNSSKTSFIVSGRRSYYNLITRAFLNAVYDNTDPLTQFTNMYYYDINAKLSRDFSDNDKLSYNFYLGHDMIDSDGKKAEYQDSEDNKNYTVSSKSDSKNNWGNIVSGLKWRHLFSDKLSSGTMLNYSRFRYYFTVASDQEYSETYVDEIGIDSSNTTISSVGYLSEIDDISLNHDIIYTPSDRHTIMAGISNSLQLFNPTVSAYRYWETVVNGVKTEDVTDNSQGNSLLMNNLALYAEDDIDVFRFLRINAGLRFNLYSVTGRSYAFPEPRVSMRILLSEGISIKGSYSFLSQGIHLLSSSNLIMPSDIWVPVTGSIEPMTSGLYSTGIFFDLKKKVHFSVEGYYKTMNNVLEYKEGVSYINNSDGWENMVSVGYGWAYGLEFLVQKNTGRITGSIAYTCSKSLRKFDREDNIVYNGKTFYARNDCRNNLSVNFTWKISRKFDISGTFIYKTGSRGTLAETILIARNFLVSSNESPDSYWSSHIPSPVSDPSGAATFNTYYKLSSYSVKNGYKLPDYHRLDIGMNYHLYRKKGQSTINFSIYNLYNHLNIYSVYPASEGCNNALKGLCLFPFLPSLSYTYSF